jgi:tetratricopeptide (TPR) repeat protein
MTQRRSEEMTCPGCKQVQKVDIWDSINVTSDPQLMEKFINGEINVFECNGCGACEPLFIDWLYQDMEKKIMIFVQYSDRNLREEMKESDNRFPPELLDGRKSRIVKDEFDLLNKLAIFECNLDDRVVEFLRMLIVGKLHRDGVDIEQYLVWFSELNEDGDLNFLVGQIQNVEEDNFQSFPMKFQLYQSVLDSFKSQPGWEEDIDSDWLTIDINYVMERFDASQIEIPDDRRVEKPTNATDAEVRDAELVDEAVQLMQEGESARALGLLEEVISRTPDNYVNQFEEDDTLYIKFWDQQDFLSYVDWYEAEGKKQELIWLFNAYPRAYFYMGYIYFENADYETAITFLDKGLILEPDQPSLLNEKAQCMIKLGRNQEALALFDQVLSQSGFVNPHKKAVALRGKGYVFIEENDLDAAERAFLESLELEPDSMLAKNELEFIASQRDFLKEAERFGISEEEFRHWSEFEQAILSGLVEAAEEMDWNDVSGDLNGSIGKLAEKETESTPSDAQQSSLDRMRMVGFVRIHRDCAKEAEELGISEEEFKAWYQGYYASLSIFGKNSNWNEPIDDLVREVGALTEQEIEAARTDFHQAILNRIKVRVVMEKLKAEND